MTDDSIANQLESLELCKQDYLSPLERLPVELILKIVEYAQDSVFGLRLVSRMLRCRMDEYMQSVCRKAPLQIVDEIRFSSGPTLLYQGKTKIDVAIVVPEENRNEFVFRLLHHCLFSYITRIQRTQQLGLFTTYKVAFIDSIDDESWLEDLNECIGSRVGKVSIIFDEKSCSAVSKTLNGIIVGDLNFTIDNLSECASNFLQWMLSEHSVDKLTLVDRTDTSLFSQENFLLALSSLVHSLRINQPSVPGDDKYCHYSYGIDRINHATIIFDMFSRKLDKLFIDNFEYLKSVEDSCVEELKQQIPLLNKKIWFVTSTSRSLYQATPIALNNDYIAHDRLVEKRAARTIIHSSRTNEPF